MATTRKAKREDRFKITASVRAWHAAVRMRRAQPTDAGEPPPKTVFHAFRMRVADQYGGSKSTSAT